MQNAPPDSATQLTRYVEQRAAIDSPWIATIRQQALNSFLGRSWPTQSEEEWRRTDISNYDLESFPLSDQESTTIELPAGFAKQGGKAWPLKALVDSAGVATDNELPNVTHNIEDRIRQQVIEALEQRLQSAENRFQLWNIALLQEGWLLSMPAALQEPVVITTMVEGAKKLVAPHIIILAEAESQLNCVHRLLGDVEGEFLLLPDCTLVVGPAARLHYVCHARFNIDSLLFGNGYASIARDGYLRHVQTLFGGMCAKVRFDALLAGEGSTAYLDGIYFGHEDQHFDLRTVQRHQAPHTQSFALYRGAATDESHIIYQGMIQVAHEAVGTDAYLTNNNLLLSDEARSDSIPSLNINTDEVKCSHGSTTGKIDELQYYYLQCRGFSQQEALSFIVTGFFVELINRLPEQMQEELINLVQERIPTEDAPQ